MVDSSLKQTDPQKYYYKTLCKIMYYIGMGDSWYENAGKSTTSSILYKIWQAVSNGFILLNIFNEILAFLRTDLKDKEREELFQYTMGQLTVVFKMIVLYSRRHQIMVVMQRLIEGSRSVFYSIELERAAMKVAFRYILAFLVLAIVTLVSGLLTGYKAHVKEGVPVRSEIVFYPAPKNTGAFVNILRVLVEYHFFHIVVIALALDGLVLCSLLTIKCKFQVIQLYFKNVQTKTLMNATNKSMKELEEDFKNDLIIGIKMHEEALWCVRNVQESMGAIYSVQVVESVLLMVLCLTRAVTTEHTTTNLMYNMTYMACIIVITAFYMLTAGDISHEASMLPTSIFHCGWELTRPRADLRVLAVVALLRSQAPVTMTAFGVFKLSYKNFIKILRTSYSFFAVMY